jgi:hypothetical protein
MLLREMFRYRFKKEVILSRPCIYGVFDGPFGGFKPIKESCVGCMRCVQEYPDIMKVDYSKEYQNLGDSYWKPGNVFTVWYEAATGKIPVRGMGYKGPFAGNGFDSIWTDMSEIVRPTRDGVYGREFISTVVDIGRKLPYLQVNNHQSPVTNYQSRVLDIPIPIIFDALPEKSSNHGVQTAIAKTAQKLNTFFISRINQLPVTESKISGTQLPNFQQENNQLQTNCIPLITSKDLDKVQSGSNGEFIKKARMIEYEYNGDVGATRRLALTLRDINPDAILSVRLSLDERITNHGKSITEVAALLTREGVDVLHVYADYQGIVGTKHLSDKLLEVHNHLVEEGIRDEVTIVASGGVILAEHIPKTIIRGADLVALDTTLLVALQSKFDGESVSHEEFGLRPHNIDVEWGTQRLVNLMASWHNQLIEILSAMGIRDVRRLRGEVGRSMTFKDLEEEAFGEIEKVNTK